MTDSGWRKRQIALDKMADNARELGLDYEIHSCSPFCDKPICVAEAVQAEREHYDDLFDTIKNWCEAYPIAVYPEPDFKKAHEVLKAQGMTLDAISAYNMKHVITQVQKMIDAAIRARGQA